MSLSVCSVYVTWWVTRVVCGRHRWMEALSSAAPQTAHSKCGMLTQGCAGTLCTATPPRCAACRCVETSESDAAFFHHSPFLPSFCPSCSEQKTREALSVWLCDLFFVTVPSSVLTSEALLANRSTQHSCPSQNQGLFSIVALPPEMLRGR